MTDKDITDLNVPQNNNIKFLNKGKPPNTYENSMSGTHLTNLKNLDEPMVWKSGGITQQAEDCEIIDDKANESNNMLEDTEDTMYGRQLGELLDGDLRKIAFEVKVNNFSDSDNDESEESSSSEDDESDDEVVDEKDSKMGKENQTKSQSINREPTVKREYMNTRDSGPVPLQNLIGEDKEWLEFLHGMQDEVDSFHTIMTPKSYLDELISQEIASMKPTVTPIEQLNLVDYTVRPPGPPPGYERMEVWVPIPDDALTEKEAKHNPVMKRAKKLIKKGRQNDVTFTLNCKYIRHVT